MWKYPTVPVSTDTETAGYLMSHLHLAPFDISAVGAATSVPYGRNPLTRRDVGLVSDDATGSGSVVGLDDTIDVQLDCFDVAKFEETGLWITAGRAGADAVEGTCHGPANGGIARSETEGSFGQKRPLERWVLGVCGHQCCHDASLRDTQDRCTSRRVRGGPLSEGTTIFVDRCRHVSVLPSARPECLCQFRHHLAQGERLRHGQAAVVSPTVAPTDVVDVEGDCDGLESNSHLPRGEGMYVHTLTVTLAFHSYISLEPGEPALAETAPQLASLLQRNGVGMVVPLATELDDDLLSHRMELVADRLTRVSEDDAHQEGRVVYDAPGAVGAVALLGGLDLRHGWYSPHHLVGPQEKHKKPSL